MSLKRNWKKKNKMWTIIKFDRQKLELFKQDMRHKVDKDFSIYKPTLLIQKFKNNKLIDKHYSLLGDYIFCYHKIFSSSNGFERVKFFKGVKYFLSGSTINQKEIIEFIKKCKNVENKDGYITQNTFTTEINKFYKFKSGPFTEKIFKIIEVQKHKINILMGNIKTSINKKDYLFDLI